MASGRFMEEMMREHEQSLLCGGLFDHIDDLLDFPKEDCAADVLLLDAPAPGSPLAARVLDACGGLPPVKAEQPEFLALPPPPPPALAAEESAFMAALGDGHIGSCDELDMDMAQLEWLSGLFDDASIPHEPAFAGCAQPIIRASALSANAGVVLPDNMEDALFRSSSPTSVLEDSGFNANKNSNNNGGSSASSSSSSASSSSESFSGSARPWSVPVSPRPEPPVFVIPARARSKRSRASAFPTAIRAAAPPPEATILVPTHMYWPTTSSYSEPECIAESNNSQPPAMKKKKKKVKRPAPPVTSDAEGDGDADYEEGSGGAALPPGAVRRCTHCQIEKTPQWRAGPLGPKTLCNACGVRYKSGRLFPEYRPAASPTFVPAVHSNSHKKVVEMRQKVEPKGDDLLQFIRRRD